MDSDEDAENEEISPNRRNVILRNDTQEELPSGVEKSRSTNFRSTVKDRRKPPLPYNSGYSNNLFGDTSKD